MKIGINVLGLLPSVIGGGETYIRGLLAGLSRLGTDAEFTLFTNRDNHATFEGLGAKFRRVRCNFSARWSTPALAMTRVVGEQIYLPWRAARERLDVIHSPLDTIPLAARCATVMTLHDTNFAALPEAVSDVQRAIARALVKVSARRARAIITVSEFSRREILARLPVNPQRLFVVYNGAGPDGFWDAHQRLEARSDMPVDGRYLLAFSSINAHKNIAALIRAFARLSHGGDYRLAVAGHLPRGAESLPELAESLGVGSRVIFTGYVSEELKARLLRNARLLAFPSLYEGFGLPVIEAMQAGVPVACSRAAALPEIAGAAARFFDPHDIEDIRSALDELLTDEHLRARLVEAGRLNARRFSWASTARRTMWVYRHAAGIAPEEVTEPEPFAAQAGPSPRVAAMGGAPRA